MQIFFLVRFFRRDSVVEELANILLLINDVTFFRNIVQGSNFIVLSVSIVISKIYFQIHTAKCCIDFWKETNKK